MKLCILGGGGFRTPFVWQALLRDAGTPRVDRVSLYDTDATRLQTMRSILTAQAADFPDAPTLETSTDLDPALDGSDFVFAAIRVGGVRGRQCDEHVALDRGVLGQETTGPGGLAYALRTLPVMIDIARRIRERAPQAYLLNFTNPAGIITEALQTELGDRVVGICDTPSEMGRRIAGILGHDHTAITMDYAGLNHLGWMRKIIVGGRDVLPDLLADDALLSQLEESEIFGADWLRTLGMIPNEYLYYYYFQREAVQRIRNSGPTRGDFLARTQQEFYTAAAEAAAPAVVWQRAVDEREASYMAEAKGGTQGAPAGTHDAATDPSQLGYAGVALAVMRAISRNEPASAILNVRNNDTIPALPPDAVVEVPTTVDGTGIHPSNVTQPGLHQIGLMQQVKEVERHVIAAAREHSARQALLAFALHPLVDSVQVAADLLAGYRAAIPEVAAVFDRS
ncbi:6-phospho-beta-glucosidase [Microlunatus soli]|uniref:6-phospho-beta-glucosidase n=1 Tax=Microlunatus soli TaxID=630515 RepID=A0A1H1P0A3_9ACTN|nr:6-phospho-beta-glucosidase [Microlunatus soli]SDS04455.1 6-phospho-beta-glucosidase [Microlunatus soli]